MLAIIDADSIACACGATEELSHALSNTKNKMLSIIKETACEDYTAILTAPNDKTSFRLKLYPEYKANRKGVKRPKFEKECKDYLVKHWQAAVVETIEADDAVSMAQWTVYNGNFDFNIAFMSFPPYDGTPMPAVLCGIDKDLDQVPGLHYNYRKREFKYITPIEGLKALYLQMLTGDRADNIPRIKKGWKKKEAEELIKFCNKESELISIVYTEIDQIHKISEEYTLKEIQWRGDLLYLWRKKEDRYRIPK